MGGDRVILKNINRNNMLIEGNNQIHIGFLKQPKNLNKLFDYNGDFKITSAKINDQVVTVKAINVDFYELIDSNWDNAGEPEKYKGTYVVGKVPRKRKSIGGTKTSSKARSGVRRAITGSTSRWRYANTRDENEGSSRTSSNDIRWRCSTTTITNARSRGVTTNAIPRGF